MAQKVLSDAWEYFSGHRHSMSRSNENPAALLPVFESEPDIPSSRTPVRLKKVRRHIGYPRHPVLSITKRAKYGGWGCTLYGWPSSGGVVIREQADLVELRYLGLDPFNMPTSRHADPDDEDKFCVALRKIGGKWWRSEQRSIDVWVGDLHPDTMPTEEEEREVYIGWPKEGGVLVLEGNESAIPPEVGMLRMVGSMEERCWLLRDKLGAVYYADPRAYPGFAVLGPVEYKMGLEDTASGGKVKEEESDV